MTSSNPVPNGYQTVTPYLIVSDGAAALDFYTRAFGAEVLIQLPGPGGEGLLHAELKLGDSIVMLADERGGPTTGRAPRGSSPTGFSLHLYVEDVDRLFRRAVDAGCKVVMPLYDAFWGDRYGKVQDPFGHAWSLSSRVRDMSKDEVLQAAEQYLRQPS